MTDLLRHSVQVCDRLRSGDGQGRLETGQVPGLGGRRQGEGVLRTGHGQVRGETRPRQDDGRVNLIRHHPDAEPAGKLGNLAQFLAGVHRPGRVVRVAQQVRNLAARSAGTRERVLQGAQVDSAVGVQRGLDHAAAVVRYERVERGVDRWVDDHGITTVGDQTQRFDDAEHDVGDDRGAAYVQVVPLPAPRGEFTDRFGKCGAARVSGVADVDGPAQGLRHGRGQHDVHLRDPERQDVGRVRAPLHTGAQPQLGEREFLEWVKRHPGRLGGKRVLWNRQR